MFNKMMSSPKFLTIPILFLLIFGSASIPSTAQNSRRPELIRDTDIADGNEDAETPQAREHDPDKASQNINIGNFYLKRRNYPAAIARYLEALTYDENSIPAHEALSRAYEKNGDTAKAVLILKTLMEKNPQAPKTAQYRKQLDQLEKAVR